MDLGLTEIQQMLKNSAREFLSQECPLSLVREMEEDQKGYTDELWRQLVSPADPLPSPEAMTIKRIWAYARAARVEADTALGYTGDVLQYGTNAPSVVPLREFENLVSSPW